MKSRLAILVTIAAASAIAGCGDSTDAADSRWVAGKPAAVRTDDPVEAFAPLVVHHAKEELFPIGAWEFIDNSTFKWLYGFCLSYDNVAAGEKAEVKAPEPLPRVDPARLGAASDHPYRHRIHRCDGSKSDTTYAADQHTRPFDTADRPAGLPPTQGFYLERLTAAIPGAPLARRGGRRVVQVPAYFDSRPERVGGHPGLRLTYWLLYAHNGIPANAPGLEHEGDWERVGVLLRRTGPNTYLPVSLRYFASTRLHDLPWGEVNRVPGARATHPVLFAALGTHTLYPSPGIRKATARARVYERILTGPERAMDCPACPTWRTWTSLRDARKQQWYGFGGGWGATYGDADDKLATKGPLGPSRYTVDVESVE